MRASAHAVVLCVALLGVPATAEIKLDLASLPPGPVVEHVLEGRSHDIALTNLQPGTIYRLSFGPRHPSVELLRPDSRGADQLRTWASESAKTANC